MASRVLLAVLLLAGASPARAGTLVLHAYSTDDGAAGDPDIERDALLVHRLNGTRDRVLLKAQDPVELKTHLESLDGSGTTVRRLIVDSHGAAAASGPLDEATVPAFKGLDRVFAPGAEIVFHACSVAEGADGRRFLEEVARTLLTKGGRVTAPLWYYAGGTPRLRSAAGPVGGKLEGWSLAGWLRFELRPDGTGSFTRLLPGTQETRELGQTLSEQARDAYRRAESRARSAAGAAAAGARRAESGARAAWSRAASLLPKPGGLGRLFDGR